MIKAIDLSSTINYTSKFDKDEPKTVFKLGMLDARIRKMIEDIAFEYEMSPGAPEDAKAKAKFNLGKSELDLIAFGLKGFENFIDPSTGKQIHYKDEERVVNGVAYHVCSGNIIKLLPGSIIKELAEKIKEINNVTPDEEKN